MNEGHHRSINYYCCQDYCSLSVSDALFVISEPIHRRERRILSEVSVWTRRAGSLPTGSVCLGPPALGLLFSPDFFSLGLCSTQEGEEVVMYLRTPCKSSLDLSNQFLKQEARTVPSFIWSEWWICLKQRRLHTSDPELIFKKDKKYRYVCQ